MTKITGQWLALIYFAILPFTAAAGEIKPPIIEQPHNLYHVIKSKTLSEATLQIANRSGITFKILPGLENDPIEKKLAADDWKDLVGQLLSDYNHTAEFDQDKIKSVIITGRNGSGQFASDHSQDIRHMIVVAPDLSKKLPGKYIGFNPGSVMNVEIPVAELSGVALGDDFTLDLPIGQYNVKHDSAVKHGDGSFTWMGFLDEEGKGYRVYLSQGDSGIMGNVYTPDGAYNIDTVDGITVLVDIERSGLQNSGHEHDDIVPSAHDFMEAGFRKSADLLTSLKDAAEAARVKADALAKEAETLYAKYKEALDNANQLKNTMNQLQGSVDTASRNLVTAREELIKSPRNKDLRANSRSAADTLRVLRLELSRTTSLYKRAEKNAITLQKDHAEKLKLAEAAEANAQKAEAAYLAELEKSKTNDTAATEEIPVTTVVDLMVLYTTEKQTAEYAKQRIQYLVDISNQSYKDSGVNMALRLVHTRRVGYAENSGNTQALYDLAYDRGVFQGTAAARNQYGADLVMLFRPLYAQTSGSCGTAFVGFANGGNGIPNFGFGTISDGYSKDSQSNYFCAINTFTHEIGHSLGLVHDREFSSFEGKFPYSYAWGVGGKFGTIMSYYGPAVMLFSTPDLPTQCAGTPCGFAEGDPKSSDQSKTVNFTAPIVSNYRPTMVSAPVIE